MSLEVKDTKKYDGTVYDMGWEVWLMLSMAAWKNLTWKRLPLWEAGWWWLTDIRLPDSNRMERPPVSTLQWRFIIADGSNLCQALLVGWKNLKSYLPCKHCEDSGDLSSQAWMRAKTNWEQRDQTQILYSDEYEGIQLYSCCRTLNSLFESALGPFIIYIPISVFPPCWFHSEELDHIVVF